MDESRIGFNKFMNEQRSVNRWFILRIALVGAFAGALLAVAYMMTIAI
jgi:hypothetical protein